ncbi:fatty acyl-CoA reductase 3-like isoform X2 [Lotus japonicus]|uniref:fatty acyl-CoA reductase 3-like isoform X2 n=1 Tax=Lotus japonicus TaxID=34305 RepID=UPI0025864B4F|nr:fatty acyl-CoA reductase 3-like isoform X2 [Lotus japonicus]
MKDLFRVLRDKLGADFDSFISKKVVAVAGDVSRVNLGLDQDKNLKDEVLEELDVIVHTAAATTFDERYDIAMGTNTMGAFNVVNFVKNCHKLKILLHVSTAYVCGEKGGLIVEEPLHIGQMKKGSSNLDIFLEKQMIEEKLKELRAHNANEGTIKSVMQSFGLLRAKMHGWPNTYVFTKSMAEMLLVKMKDTLSLPLIIIRPTMILGTYSEPFPGWVEGVRTIDFVVAKYGNGTMTSFVGKPEIILDVW